MAAAAVPVPPAVVGREQVAEGRQQVVVAARAGLDDRDARRRVRDEDVQQPVAAPGDEVPAVVGEVEDDLLLPVRMWMVCDCMASSCQRCGCVSCWATIDSAAPSASVALGRRWLNGSKSTSVTSTTATPRNEPAITSVGKCLAEQHPVEGHGEPGAERQAGQGGAQDAVREQPPHEDEHDSGEGRR